MDDIDTRSNVSKYFIEVFQFEFKGKFKMDKLTDQQREMIEMKRRQAIELREKRLNQARINQEMKSPQIKTTTLPSITSMRSPQSSMRSPQSSMRSPQSSMRSPQSSMSPKNISMSQSKHSQLIQSSMSPTNTSMSPTNTSMSPTSISMSQSKHTQLTQSMTSLNEPMNKRMKQCDEQVKRTVQATIKLVSSERFSVEIPYESEINDRFRRMNTRNFDMKTKQWSFDVEEYKNVILQLKSLTKCQIVIKENSISEQLICELIKAREKQRQNIDLNERISSKLMTLLMEFQKEGVKFCIKNDGKCLYADEMGLGKTIQALACAQWYINEWPFVVVCPSSVRFQWEQSICEWLDVDSSEIQIVQHANEQIDFDKITIFSYDLMARMVNSIKTAKKHFEIVIFDESHYLKSSKANRTEAASALAKFSKRIMLLSGTPALSRPIGETLYSL